MRYVRSLVALFAILSATTLCSCSSSSGVRGPVGNTGVPMAKAGTYYKVKTTAYSHTESDHLKYARGSATGNALKYGQVRSAAADWSVFPVGTLFKIAGQPYIYEVDDYGRALVGTKTIDIYQPSKAGIAAWGARNVNIQVLRWGSFTKSLDILEERQRHAHVRAMIANILKKNRNS